MSNPMNRRPARLLGAPFLFIGLALTVSPAVARAKEGASGAAPRPNILYIMADDHAYQAVSAYGYGLNPTPNIDRLASEGMRFTVAW